MDILRLPSTLRYAVLQHHSVRRLLHTAARVDATPDFLPPSLASSPALLTLSSATLNSYEISLPPTSVQLGFARSYFSATPPEYLFTAPYFRSFPPSPHPEVAFLGRSNVGKSSLLNALFGRTSVKDAHVSKRPGRTRTMNGFGVSGGLASGAAPKEGAREESWRRFPRGGCVVVDMPGYGGGSREEWGKEAMKYLENRKQLRRTFVLVDAEHGLKSTDVQLLTHLRRQGIAHQVILRPLKLNNGLLKLKDLCGSIRQRLNEEAGGRDIMLDVLCSSSEKGLDETSRHRKLGIDEVRWAVLNACGLECDEQGKRRKASIEDIKIQDEDE
ncbi:hypothetical protein LTR53_017227 [Teratosphaeriaceae sp. CCFEE 6253]|nr:hypothetical protein LTR53_017227 [Teratosphaeriaceae sp. CCFEE 6253]